MMLQTKNRKIIGLVPAIQIALLENRDHHRTQNCRTKRHNKSEKMAKKEKRKTRNNKRKHKKKKKARKHAINTRRSSNFKTFSQC